MNAPGPALDRIPLQPAEDAPLWIVVNGASGHQDADEACVTIAGLCDEAGRTHDFLRIPDPGRIAEVAAEAVRRAKAVNGIVVAVGGDGTLSAVAQAALDRGCAFAALPQGTFNYFGRTHGIPQDLGAAVRGLLRATLQPVQVGRVNGRVFLVNASLGLYPELLEDREAAKQAFGRSRWVAMLAGLRTLMHGARRLQVDVDSEGGRRTVRTSTLFVGNNALQFARLGIGEDAAPGRGRLAGIIIRPATRLALLGLALKGALGRLGDAENIESFAFSRLTVSPRGRRRIKVAIDGEILWLRSPLRFEVSPESLSLMLPPPEHRVPVE